MQLIFVDMRLFNYDNYKRTNFYKNVREDASCRFTIKLFNGQLYYAYNGVPVVEIPSGTTASEMVERLTALRDTYVRYQAEMNNIEKENNETTSTMPA